MRAEALLLAAALLTTGCASLTPSPGRGMNLGYTSRSAPGPVLPQVVDEEPPHSVSAPPSIAESETPERLLRHRKSRGEATGAGPGNGAVAVGGAVARDTEPGEDVWEQLLTDAGLEAGDARPLSSGTLTPTQAARLLGTLLEKKVTLRTFPPRMAAGFLLREVMEGGEVSHEELLRRVERFNHGQVAVLRPDGYLARATSGQTQQKVGPVEWKDGAFRAGRFELGRFYNGRRGIFLPTDAQLRAVDGPPLAEVYSDADVINRSLDGAEDAFVELYHALGQFLSHPTDSITGLLDLPSAVAALITSAPEYLEHYLLMTRGEQIREAARLTTSVLVTWGGASATTRTLGGAMGGAEAMVPVLSLSAEGALALERVAVPVGRAAAVLSGGPGAAIILQRTKSGAGGAPPPDERGPGQWGPSDEKGASEAAQAYQAQISGHPYEESYWVGGVGRKNKGVSFDGFKDGVLLEAKGISYEKFFKDDLDPKPWYVKSQKAQGLIEQATRQRNIVRSTGIPTPIEWHVAEKHAADAMRKLFGDNGLKEITVIHTPAR